MSVNRQSIGRYRAAARRFFKKAIGSTKATPVEVVADHAAVYPKVLGELAPAAWHRTEQYADSRMEADYGQLKRRLHPTRGLKLTSAPESSSLDTSSSRPSPRPLRACSQPARHAATCGRFRTVSSWRCDTDEPTETGPACLPI